MPQARIGIIGGTGLEQMEGLTSVQEVDMDTPFGKPSDVIVVGMLGDMPVAFLSRHGRGHHISPSELPARANIWAFKTLGVERIISIGAVGSLKEEISPRHFVFPDQLVDETKGRKSTFFGDGIVGHVPFAHPYCDAMSGLLHETAQRLGITCHKGGVYCCMEGPAFSTKAESAMHRALGYSIIGMTAIPEAKLAREAEICYSAVAAVTDYDCWKEGEEVDNRMVVEHLFANVANAQNLLERAVPQLARLPRSCPCAKALDGAVFTHPDKMPKATLKRLELILGKYVTA
ncbi:MAG: S-methyl-5'-thioadenosine phosphorylase [Elusimicrobia bacterium]|nr:S-methyl-5'-thioadenosine phosphorylase [Elusimicrobiota bacterium]